MTNEDRKDMQALAKRVPARYIQTKPGAGDPDYISHSEIQQMLLAKLSVPPSQRIVQVIYGGDSGTSVHGVILEVTYVIDGETVVVQEAGACDRPQSNNGANLKNAVSSAVNRCAMRIGLGLELWSQDFYVLDKAFPIEEKVTEDDS